MTGPLPEIPYEDFLAAKACISRRQGIESAFDIELPPLLKPHQVDIIRWALAGGFISYEPALEMVNFRPEWLKGLDWVIIGGESGPGARPFSLRWVTSVIKQCAAAGVPCFVKQLGARPGIPSCASFDCPHPDCGVDWLKLKDRKGGDPSEWPDYLRVREFPA